MTDGDRPLDAQIGERCDICGRYYRIHYLVPDDVWALITPTGWETGYLCMECADFRARKLGIRLLFKADRCAEDRSGRAIVQDRRHYQKMRQE